MRIGLVVSLLFLAPEYLDASENDDEVTNLERAFLRSSLEVIHETEDLPGDAGLVLRSQPHATGIADLGEVWNSTDLITQDQPMVRHLFSGISDEVAAIVYQSGGYRAPMVFLLLMNRKSDWYCKYVIGTGFRPSLSLETIRHLFRDPTGEKLSCDRLSL